MNNLVEINNKITDWQYTQQNMDYLALMSIKMGEIFMNNFDSSILRNMGYPNVDEFYDKFYKFSSSLTELYIEEAKLCVYLYEKEQRENVARV